MPVFEPGQALCRDFYTDAVRPAIGVDHSAGLLGWGSDVLGYDTARSADHGWGPRTVVFVDEFDVAAVRARVAGALPESFRGWPVAFGWDQHEGSTFVTVSCLGDWLVAGLGLNPLDGMRLVDWLCLPQQLILGVTAGAVFHDDDGRLARVREQLAWYPDQLWWWLMACQWRRIDQEEPFVQRTDEVGDHLGSAVVAARQVRELMRLELLRQRRYAPYSKWLGTAFAALDHAGDELPAHLLAVVEATDLGAREDALGRAYVSVAGRFAHTLGDDAPAPALRSFHDRPAHVLGSDRFVQACLARVEDPWLLKQPLVGSVDQVVDSTDVLSDPRIADLLRALYRG